MIKCQVSTIFLLTTVSQWEVAALLFKWGHPGLKRLSGPNSQSWYMVDLGFFKDSPCP